MSRMVYKFEIEREEIASIGYSKAQQLEKQKKKIDKRRLNEV